MLELDLAERTFTWKGSYSSLGTMVAEPASPASAMSCVDSWRDFHRFGGTHGNILSVCLAKPRAACSWRSCRLPTIITSLTRALNGSSVRTGLSQFISDSAACEVERPCRVLRW